MRSLGRLDLPAWAAIFPASAPGDPGDKDNAMAKPSTLLIKLVSTADTGYFYVTKKNPRTATEKLALRKYDPRARKHVIFKESKMK